MSPLIQPFDSTTVGGQRIRTTGEHPFYVEGRGWVKCFELAPGDLLRGHDGRLLPVESVKDAGEIATVYNLRIAEYHTYYVGDPLWGFSVWSHNASYSSFSAFKRGEGSAGPGMVWHHIVEQSKLGRFAASTIHNTRNVVRISRDVNQTLANCYSSVRPFTGQQTVRQWLSSKSFREQFDFGRKMLNRALSGNQLP